MIITTIAYEIFESIIDFLLIDNYNNYTNHSSNTYYKCSI